MSPHPPENPQHPVNPASDNPFFPPAAPRSALEALRWVIFEPELLKAYSNTLNRWEGVWQFFKTYAWVALFIVVLYVAACSLLAATDWLGLPPEYFRENFLAAWGWGGTAGVDFYPKFTFLLSYGAKGLAGGLAFIIAFYLTWFRVIFYPVHLLPILLEISLKNNPYRGDAVIWLPLPSLRRRLAAAVQANPVEGEAFIVFLLRYRPLQRGLAQHLLHAHAAEAWRQAPLETDALAPPHLVEPWEKPPTWLNVLETPDKLHPSPTWREAVTGAHAQLAAARSQSSIALKLQEYSRFVESLGDLKRKTLLESPRWNHYYLPTLDTWLAAAEAERAGLQREAAHHEPIARNLYRPGEALRPGSDTPLFMGRADLRDKLAREILTAPQMPMFLLQGQRRVGKSSLLNFLPELLGRGFKLVYQDCQDARVQSVPLWLQDLRQRVEDALGLENSGWQAPDEWLRAWAEFQGFLERLDGHREERLILALDEYEALHKYHFSADPAQGERLLAAMRSFSQRQNRVVFLFTGAALFSELRGPNWSQFFVQAVRFPVDYLARADALRLITEPVPELRYPLAMQEKILDLTQGHPALLQLLCRELVDIANRDLRRDMRMADLDEALGKVLNQGNLAIEVFWSEFCAAPETKQTVWQILEGQPPTHKPSLNRLKEHGYIVPDGERWRLRVPLFEQWLREFGEWE
jgi:hypothetical protein